MKDTSPEMDLKMIGMMQARSPEERLEMGFSMYDFSRQLVTEAILRERPNISPIALRLELFERFYGNDFDSDQKRKILEYLSCQ